ncbi:MAG: hypothetical protein ACTH0P_12025 [Candidatus Corynebacterium faecigallinarum]
MTRIRRPRTLAARIATAAAATATAVTVAMVPVLGSVAAAPAQDAPASVVGTVGAVGAVAAAKSLAAGERGTSYMSPELVAELGYTPGVQNGLAMNPEGDCSSPVTLPESFEPACQTHDLGYDLLRVAERTGEQIPGGLRASLDRQMADQMRGSCRAGGGAGCRAMAVVAHVGVGVNTMRQGNGAPVAEPWLDWLPW